MPPRVEALHEKVLRRARRLVPPTAFRAIQKRLRERHGIEIGGPSAVFRRWNLWPLYPVVGALDNYNFAPQTIWSESKPTAHNLGIITQSAPRGRHLIGEATLMNDIQSSTYEFLLASHVLEHIANPLRALHTWRRVIGPDATIVLAVPHRDGTFDHRRPVTSLDHILNDFANDVAETDDTHLNEILQLHDLSHDAGAGPRDAFVKRAANNIRYRSLHHHVFDTELLLKLVDKAGLRILYLDLELPYHICVACSSRSGADRSCDNDSATQHAASWTPDAEWRRTSPFPSDRRLGSGAT